MKKLGVIAILLLVSSQLLEALAPFKPQPKPINPTLSGGKLGQLSDDNNYGCTSAYYLNFIYNNYNNQTVSDNPWLFGTYSNLPVFYFCGSYNQSNENQHTPFNTGDWNSGKYTGVMGGWQNPQDPNSVLPQVFWGAGQIGGACTSNGLQGSFQLASNQPEIQPGQQPYTVYVCV